MPVRLLALYFSTNFSVTKVDSAGKGKEKILSIGADYGNNWADGFYGFINVYITLKNRRIFHMGRLVICRWLFTPFTI